jgi:hypothetical protein
MAALSDYAENKIIDALLRGQAFPTIANTYVGLFTVSPADAGGGTEVTGGAYARVLVASSLANWAGTQAAASTVASTGSSGQTSNNGTITFPTPSANWGSVVAMGVFDALTGGNLLFYATLNAAKTVNNGDPAPFFPAATLTLTIDN